MDEKRVISVHTTHSAKNKPLFKGNFIKTTKYTILTFLPKNLFFQFSRIANFYFLIIVSLLQFPWAPINASAALTPLCIVIGISAIREAIEDYLRYRSDQQINSSTAHCLNNDTNTFEDKRWDQIFVGDVIKVNQDEQSPADVVILATSENDGSAYIDTCNLDGETNLKNRQALNSTSHFENFTKNNFSANIACDLPNNQLDIFRGYIEINNNLNENNINANEINTDVNKIERHSLENKQVLLRGSSLRNTKWIIGAVIYTGHDSKIMMNSSSARTKRSYLERGLNLKLVSIFVLLFVLSILGATLGFLFEKREINTGRHYYFYRTENPRSPIRCFMVLLVSHIIVMNTMIPISLYVTLEVVRVIQAFFTVWDVEMYDSESKSFALVRTTNISDDLGQVEYIFSDKTGTLTQNVMEFMKCSIGGRKFGDGITEVEYAAAKRRGIPCKLPTASLHKGKSHKKNKAFICPEFDQILSNPDNFNNPENYEIKLFLWLLATCHSVIPKVDPTKAHGIDFQASSPDEGALVSAAADFGLVFKKKVNNLLFVDVNGEKKQVELMANLEFSSQRKRSSVVVRSPETGHIILFCKGADDLIYQRLSPESKHLNETRQHMIEFADAGLRTLCCAYKIIEEDYFNDWLERYKAASCSINEREEKIEEVSNEIENNLLLIGATAIEDKLQVGVSDTIESLLRAKMKVWVITGDKRETAINIGYACSLLSGEMKPIILDTNECKDNTTLSVKLNSALIDAIDDTNQNEKCQYALIASGAALDLLLTDEFIERFLSLAIKCQSVICCRVSPLQKALIVEKMRDKTKKLALAIGDGANDVGMILKADVGIGISGKEGRQAVLASDYAISQFRFLKRLLLVHGRLNFYRNVELINYCFYKNMVLTLNQMIFACFSSFSGNTLYDSILYMVFNMIFTCVPPVIYACLDKDVPIESMMAIPELFDFNGKKDVIQSYGRFFINLAIGVYHALVSFFIPFFGLIPFVNDRGYSVSLEDFGTTVYCSVVTITNIKIAFMCVNWTWLHHLSIWLSISIFPIIAIIVQKLDLSPGFSGCGLSLLSTPSFWFSVVGSTICAILPVISIQAIRNSQDTIRNKVLFAEHHFVGQNDEIDSKKYQVSFASLYQNLLANYPDNENQTGYAFSPPCLPKTNEGQ